MPISISKRAAALVLGLALFSSPALACDKAASSDRVGKVVATGDMQRPTRVSEGFAVEVSEKFWAAADEKRKTQLAADVACSVGTEPVSFARDRKILGVYRNGKYEALN